MDLDFLGQIVSKTRYKQATGVIMNCAYCLILFALFPSSSQDLMHLIFRKEWENALNHSALTHDVLFSSMAFAELALDPETEKTIRKQAGAEPTDDSMATILLNETRRFRHSLRENINDYSQLCNVAIHVHGKFTDRVHYLKEIVTVTVVPGYFVKRLPEKFGEKIGAPIDPTGRSVSITFAFTDETKKNENNEVTKQKAEIPHVQADVSLLFLKFSQGKFQSLTHHITLIPKEIPETSIKPMRWELKNHP